MKIKSLIQLTGAAALLPFTVSAATITWDGAGDATTYEDGGNWGGTAPANDLTTDVATFAGGTVDLSATQQVNGLDFDSGTTLSGSGSIEVGSGGIVVDGNSTISTAGLELNQATAITLNGTLDISSVLTGTGDLTVTAGSATAFSMTGTSGNDDSSGYSGNVTFDGIDATVGRYFVGNTGGTNTLSLLNGASISANNHLNMGSRNIVISGGAQINQYGDRNIYGFDGVISGTGGLTFGHVAGSGGNKDKVQLQGTANTFTGGVIIDGTDVHTNGSGSLGDAANEITIKNGGFLNMLGGGDHVANRNIVLEGTGNKIQNTGGWSYSGAISGTGSLELVGSGDEWRWNDSFGNTYSGGTILDNVGMRVRGDTLGTGDITLKNGSFLKNYKNNGITIANNIILDAGSGGGIEAGWGTRTVTLTGLISGEGELTIRNDSGSVRLLNGSNSYSGGTEVQGHVNAVSGGFGTSGVTLNSNVDGSRGWVQNLSGEAVHTNNLIIGDNGGRLKAGWDSNLEFQGVVSGSGALTIEGDSGTVVFSNTGNTFTGDIVLQDATSRLSVASLGGGAYNGVISGDAAATFNWIGDGTFSGTNDFAGATIVADGASIGGSGSFAGDLTLETGSKFIFSDTDTLTVSGAVSLFSGFGVDDIDGLDESTTIGSFTLIEGTSSDFSGVDNFGQENWLSIGGGKFAYFQTGSLELVVAVPEPGTFALLAGMLALGSVMIRRRRA